jgi:hypothetical protein
MGVKGEEPVFTPPELLHAGEALKNKAHVSWQGGVNLIEGRLEFLGLAGFLHPDDAAGGIWFLITIKLEEEVGAAALAVGKAVQDDEAGIIGQVSQFVQEIFGRAIKTHINYGLVLELGSLKKIEAKNRGQATGIVMPDHIVPDE